MPEPTADDAQLDELRDGLRRELARVQGRLRALPLDRLDGEPAALARAAAQDLADLAADAQQRPRRSVPQLEVHGVPDQLAVTAHDVLAEGDRAALSQALDVLTALRRAL
ncbi:hypothetical protein ACPPVT_04655 [Angustibacter sp. McL0619]|uniref:hypothetical protein n=1 Tax=Angustibacter sp. McL0619 TaxID=3415676 RepID=UPI003CF191F1